MTDHTIDREGVSAALGAAPDASRLRATPLAAFGGLVLRDLRVVTAERGKFLVRTLSQPLLLVFVFAYVFPRIGQSFEASGGRGSFTDVLVPGVVAITVLTKGIQAVALPLVQDFGYTREIEDRVMAPLPVWAVAVEKIVAGAAQGLVGALIVLPLSVVVPAEPVMLRIGWPDLIAVLTLAPVLSSAFGLALGTNVAPNQVPLMFSVVILPITFLGAVYFPWSALGPIPWLQILVLVNPLVYICEGFRMALTPQVGHMPAAAIYLAIVGFTVVAGWLGIRGFCRQVLT
jgi:ABC-2 type transport system permease protein